MANRDGEVEARKKAERQIYLVPVIVTKRWYPVVERYFGADMIPALPVQRHSIPPFPNATPSRWVMTNYDIYSEYVQKCVPFGGNALVVLFLRQLKLTFAGPSFANWRAVIDECLDNGDFEVTKDECTPAEEVDASDCKPSTALVDFSGDRMYID